MGAVEEGLRYVFGFFRGAGWCHGLFLGSGVWHLGDLEIWSFLEWVMGNMAACHMRKLGPVSMFVPYCTRTSKYARCRQHES